MKRTYYLDINNLCNNNCIGCANPSVKEQQVSYFIDKLTAAKDTCDRLLISGGEPTLANDFFKILDFASNSFNKISIMSNGRSFASPVFMEKFKKYKTDELIINLNGHTSDLHDSWTGVKGSFDETVAGIRNLVSNNSNVLLVFIVWKENFSYIGEFLDLARKLGVQKIRIANLLPVGRASLNYPEISVDYSKIDFKLISSEGFTKLEIEDFPYCVIPPGCGISDGIYVKNTCRFIFNPDGSVRSYPGLFLLNEDIDINDYDYINKNIEVLKSIAETSFEKISKCQNCPRSEECAGFFKDYLKLYEVN